MKVTTESRAYSFRRIVRERTGTSMLDSGGVYGYQWEKPDLPEDAPLLSVHRYPDGDVLVSIETGVWLDMLFDVDQGLQEEFLRFDEEFCEGRGRFEQPSWGEVMNAFAARRGWHHVSSDNPYNYDNDLAQVYSYHVFQDDEGSDWICDPEHTYMAIMVHTGCDVRGGYTKPYWVRSVSADQILAFLNPRVGIGVCGVKPPHEDFLDPMEETRDVTRMWQLGYTSSPLYEFGRDENVDRVFYIGTTGEHPYFVVRLKDGHLIHCYFEVEAEWIC